MFVQLLGGIGLFLLGMLLMTDGLKTAAGSALRRVLVRFTDRPPLAFASGLSLAALVQSSSATTLATIGFVSAGLLPFASAVGVVVGASVGTTTTGWIVSLLGLKLSVGQAAMPLVGIGALVRLLLRDRAAAAGLALAGFGLMFVGLDTLQQGMGALAGRLQPEHLPAPGLGGRLLLVFGGLVFTVIVQSSSAAIATTITAFHAGTVNLEQALALVIGASIGTTFTSAVATIGGSVAARRTGLAHVLFNVLAGILGFVLAPLAADLLPRFGAGGDGPHGALGLAAFHTAYSLAGALLVLPVVPHFLAALVRLVPERGPALTRHLDASLREVPEVAVEALRRTLVECTAVLLGLVRARLQRGAAPAPGSLVELQAALREARTFLGRIPPFLAPAGGPSPRLGVVHALDHLDQFAFDLATLPGAPADVADDRVAAVREQLTALVDHADDWLQGRAATAPAGEARALSARIAERRRSDREMLLAATARGDVTPDFTAAALDAVRWMDSAAYHTWRIVHHLAATDSVLPAADARAPV